MNVWVMCGVILYLALMVFIGFYYRKRSAQSMSHFLLGNRELPWWVGAISERASAMSGWWTLGFPGMGATTGVAASFYGWGCSITAFLNWSTLCRRLRKLSGYYKAVTLPELFQARFRDKTGLVRLLSSLVILIFMVAYMSSQLVALGKVFSTVFGIDYIYGTIIGMVITMLYTMLGGYLAVVMTDVIQGFLMCFTLLLLPILVLIQVGGPQVVILAINEIQPSLLMVNAGLPRAEAIVLVISGLANGLPLLGQPHVVNRLMSVKEVDDMRYVKRGATLGGTMDFFATICAIGIGIIALGVFGSFSDAETSIFRLIHEYVPAFLAGIMFSGIMAAIMSTVNSMLLISAGEVIENIYHRTFNRQASQKSLVVLTRVALVVLTVVACYGALEGGSVFQLTLYAYNGFGAAFVPLIFGLIFWRRLTKAGALACMISGTAITILWSKLALGQYFMNVNASLPCTLISCLIMIVVSLLTKPPQEVEADFAIFGKTCAETDGMAQGVEMY